MIPPQVMVESRSWAQETLAQGKPVSWVAAAIIIIIWVIVAGLAAW